MPKLTITLGFISIKISVFKFSLFPTSRTFPASILFLVFADEIKLVLGKPTNVFSTFNISSDGIWVVDVTTID